MKELTNPFKVINIYCKIQLSYLKNIFKYHIINYKCVTKYL